MSKQATKKVRTISAAKKASTTKSTGRNPPVAAFLNASSEGDAHAEYTTNTTRNVCHHLHLINININIKLIFFYSFYYLNFGLIFFMDTSQCTMTRVSHIKSFGDLFNTMNIISHTMLIKKNPFKSIWYIYLLMH